MDLSKETLSRLSLLDARIDADANDEEALIERGRILWGLDRRADAIRDYLAARRINPGGKADQLLQASYSILDFYNKDLYNP